MFKEMFVVAFAAIAAVSYTEATVIQCPPHNDVNVTLLPNPDDCKTYYSCNEGIPYLMYCGPGLEFNPIEKVCDFPEHAQCSKHPSSSSAAPSSSSAQPETSTVTAPSPSPVEPLCPSALNHHHSSRKPTSTTPPPA